MRKIFILIAFLLSVVPSTHADSPKDFASWWIKNYGVVDSKTDPLVERAEKVFERVAAASDKRGNRLPRLIIIKASGDPYAQAIKDGSVILTQEGLRICYQGVTPEKGDARLALFLDMNWRILQKMISGIAWHLLL
jgi:hypothetical protein